MSTIYRAFVSNHRRQGSYHFPSLNRTLSHGDSKEIKKGIKSIEMNGLAGMTAALEEGGHNYWLFWGRREESICGGALAPAVIHRVEHVTTPCMQSCKHRL
jgi:hypothetical protein